MRKNSLLRTNYYLLAVTKRKSWMLVPEWLRYKSIRRQFRGLPLKLQGARLGTDHRSLERNAVLGVDETVAFGKTTTLEEKLPGADLASPRAVEMARAALLEVNSTGADRVGLDHQDLR